MNSHWLTLGANIGVLIGIVLVLVEQSKPVNTRFRVFLSPMNSVIYIFILRQNR